MAPLEPLRLAPEPSQVRAGVVEDESHELEAAFHLQSHLEAELKS